MPIEVRPIDPRANRRKKVGRKGPPKPTRSGRSPRRPTPDEFRDILKKRKRKIPEMIPLGKMKKPKPGSFDYMLEQTMKPGYKVAPMLTGGQAKIAAKAPPTNKIDGKDFAVLRAEKAKGRGMGLQDEKMKPGKVKKAVVGLLARGAKKILGRKRSATTKPQDVTMKGRRSGMGSMLVELFKKKKLGTQGISGPIILGGAMKNGGMGEAKGYKKYLKGLKKAEGEQFRAKFKAKQIAKAGGKAAMTAARATTIGKIALGVAAAGLGAKEFLKRKMEKNKNKPKKKMGGGMMMQRPMGYSKGSKKEMQIKKFVKKHGTFPYVKPKKKMGGGMMMQRPMMAKVGKMTEKDKEQKRDIKKLRNRLEGVRRGGAERDVVKGMGGYMGGGMMMRPNPVGMKSGKSVKVKCKLGRNKPTKMY